MKPPRILIAGIGNIFLGDDAFGVDVARRLAERPQPEGVRVVDFGIRGFDLAYALLDGFDLVLLVDATPRGGSPGTLYVLEPAGDEVRIPEGQEGVVQTHGMNPMNVLRLVKSLGGPPTPIRVVGCEPATWGTEADPVMGLSESVQAAVDDAVHLIESLVTETLRKGASMSSTGDRREGSKVTGKEV